MKTLKLTFVALMAIGLSFTSVNAQTAQTTTPAQTNTSGQHLKKDGTPDMRYKENKTAAAKPATTAKPAATPKKAKSATPAASAKPAAPAQK